jgi:hypothetical protein
MDLAIREMIDRFVRKSDAPFDAPAKAKVLSCERVSEAGKWAVRNGIKKDRKRYVLLEKQSKLKAKP